MLSRCLNENDSRYPDYAGRGITVCERWLKFENFLADMGERPSSKHSIDRIDNDGNYESGNCRWATATEQQRNTSRNRLLTFEGRTLCIVEWSEITGISYRTLLARIVKGWDAEKALTTKAREAIRSDARTYTKDGVTMTIIGWAKAYGIDPGTLRWRVLRMEMSLEEALAYKHDL